MHVLLAFVTRDIRLALSYPMSLVMPFVSIVITVAGFAYMARLVNPAAPLQSSGHQVGYFTYVVINLAFMLLLTSALQSVAQSLRRDQYAGTLEAMFATRIHYGFITVGSGLWPMLLGIVQVAFYFLIAGLFGLRLHDVNIGALALFTLLGVACMSALGIVAAAVVIRFKQSPPSALFVGGGAVLLTGVLFPIRLLPVPLQIVSWLLPMTHALNGFRAAMLGESLSLVAPDLIWLAVATALLLPVSALVFTRWIEQAKFDGTLAAY